ncbi:hypothetical protein V8G54_034849 [Vigna mungo]|uniref:TIR domain-containing protein n=1 Tax=Vigna mungo TaxID=3915 RepID=A0AAQ3RF27_VIGMU
MEKHGEEEEFDGFSYDVFISFRGEDAGNNFVGHLRRELGREGINTFNDDRDMRTEEGLSAAVCEAIEESNIFIVVFSENYASSTWCLDELVKIIQRTDKNSKQVVYPVFYHVDPSDIRKMRNSFKKQMRAHENEIGKESQRIQAWRSALFEAASLPGMHIPTGIEWTAEGMELIPSAEHRTYFNGIYSGLLEAKLRFPDLDVWATLNTVANRKGIIKNGAFGTPAKPVITIPRLDWSTVRLPPSHDPLMQIFMMMMKQQSTSESELKTKTFWKLKESHQILRKRLSHITAAQNSASSWKNQYDELIQKFNMQYDAFVGKRVDNLYGVAKYERDSGVLKERAEEIERELDAVVGRLQKSEEFGDVMTAMLLNGVRDGILEARAILLALRTNTQTD